MERFARASALLFSAVVIAVTIWPALRDPPRDSFPLSTYPMFSTVRNKPSVHVIIGFTQTGDERRIPPKLIANAEVMQAAETVRKAIRRRQAKQLCTRVAERVAQDPEYADVVRLEVQSRQFDPRTYFTSASGRTPLRLRRRAACEVAR